VCTGCKSCFRSSATTGTITDGYDTLNYPNNANCLWLITGEGQTVITLRFTEFSTQSGKDFVRVFQCTDAGCAQQQLLAELSGAYYTVQNVVGRGVLKVVFTSDEKETYDGFTAKWTLPVICIT
jgi:hypothetical protein